LGETIRRWIGCALDFAVVVFAVCATWAAAVLLELEEPELPHPATSAASATAAGATKPSRRARIVLIVSEKDATIRGFLPC
jgi:hypothetical protein